MSLLKLFLSVGLWYVQCTPSLIYNADGSSVFFLCPFCLKPARNCSRLHLTVFNVVRRLALIGDAGGAVQEDGAEFLSSPDAGTHLPGLFSTVRFQRRRNTFAWTHTLCDVIFFNVCLSKKMRKLDYSSDNVHVLNSDFCRR